MTTLTILGIIALCVLTVPAGVLIAEAIKRATGTDCG